MQYSSHWAKELYQNSWLSDFSKITVLSSRLICLATHWEHFVQKLQNEYKKLSRPPDKRLSRKVQTLSPKRPTLPYTVKTAIYPDWWVVHTRISNFHIMETFCILTPLHTTFNTPSFSTQRAMIYVVLVFGQMKCPYMAQKYCFQRPLGIIWDAFLNKWSEMVMLVKRWALCCNQEGLHVSI